MKYKIQLWILLFIVFGYSTKAEISDSLKYMKRPLSLNIQYAGNLGLVSLGVGKSFMHEKLDVHLIYGYLPKMINGTSVHTFGIKSSYNIAKTRLSDASNVGYYGGLNAFYSIAEKTYLNYPDYYPDGYYNTNAIHSSIFAGTRFNKKVSHPKVKAISLFTEFGTLGYQLWTALSNKHVNVLDILNFSAGITLKL